MSMESLFWSLVRSLGRGRITGVDDGGSTQTVQMQLSQNETRDNTPRLAEYGFSSNPPVGCDAIAVFPGGIRTNGFVIACGSQQYRFRNLAPGEVCVSDNRGQSVYLSAAGITINGGGLPMKIMNTPEITADSPLMHCTGDIQCDGSIRAVGDITDNTGTNERSMAASREVYDTHDHDIANVQGGNATVTSKPPNQQQ